MECPRCTTDVVDLVDALHNEMPTAYCRDCIANISKRQYAETLVIFWSERVLKGLKTA